MSNKHLEHILQNAFDFLRTAIGQIYEQPKYSVINFCAAIELILKAKLVNEHWSLTLQKSGHFRMYICFLFLCS